MAGATGHLGGVLLLQCAWYAQVSECGARLAYCQVQLRWCRSCISAVTQSTPWSGRQQVRSRWCEVSTERGDVCLRVVSSSEHHSCCRCKPITGPMQTGARGCFKTSQPSGGLRRHHRRHILPWSLVSSSPTCRYLKPSSPSILSGCTGMQALPWNPSHDELMKLMCCRADACSSCRLQTSC